MRFQSVLYKGDPDDEEPEAVLLVKAQLELVGFAVALQDHRLGGGRLLVVEWQGPEPDRTESLMHVYDGGTLASLDAVRLPPEELASAAFVAACVYRPCIR